MHEWVGGDNMHKAPPEMPDKGRLDGCAMTTAMGLGAVLFLVGAIGWTIQHFFI